MARFQDLALRLLGATSGEQILKTAAAASGAITLPQGTTDFSGSGPGLVQQASSGAAFTVAPSTSGSLTVGSGLVVGTPAGGDLGAGTLNMSGNLQINQNAATPPALSGGQLQTIGADGAANNARFYQISNSGTPTLNLHKRRAGSTATQLNDALGSVYFAGFDGAADQAMASITATAAENTTSGSHGGIISLATVAAGAGGFPATRMQIGSAGGVVVGAPTGGDKGAATLNATSVYAAGVLLTSDVSLKRDIAPLPDGCLAMVGAIEPKRYRYIAPADSESAGPPGWFDRTRWGFVAQDVEAAMKGHDFGGLETDADGLRSLSYFDLLAVLWQAVRELRDAARQR